MSEMSQKMIATKGRQKWSIQTLSGVVKRDGLCDEHSDVAILDDLESLPSALLIPMKRPTSGRVLFATHVFDHLELLTTDRLVTDLRTVCRKFYARPHTPIDVLRAAREFRGTLSLEVLAIRQSPTRMLLVTASESEWINGEFGSLGTPFTETVIAAVCERIDGLIQRTESAA